MDGASNIGRNRELTGLEHSFTLTENFWPLPNKELTNKIKKISEKTII